MTTAPNSGCSDAEHQRTSPTISAAAARGARVADRDRAGAPARSARVEPRRDRDSAAPAPDRRRAPRRPASRCTMMPTAGSTGSSTRSRPAPSATDARPTSSASSAVTKPRARRVDDVPVAARRQPAVVVDDARIAALLLDDPPEALEAGARRDRVAHLLLARRPRSSATPAEHEHPRRQLDRHVDRDPAGPPPFSTSMHSMTSSALPTARPSGASIAGDDRLGPARRTALPIDTSDSASARANRPRSS